MSQSDQPDDEKLQMVLMIDKLSNEVVRLRIMEDAAIGFLETVNLLCKDGKPIFRANEGQGEYVTVLQNALINLHSKVTGAPLPPAALSDRVLH